MRTTTLLSISIRSREQTLNPMTNFTIDLQDLFFFFLSFYLNFLIISKWSSIFIPLFKASTKRKKNLDLKLCVFGLQLLLASWSYLFPLMPWCRSCIQHWSLLQNDTIQSNTLLLSLLFKKLKETFILQSIIKSTNLDPQL